MDSSGYLGAHKDWHTRSQYIEMPKREISLSLVPIHPGKWLLVLRGEKKKEGEL